MGVSAFSSPPKLLVFDWDGTLMDSVGAIVACTQQALADLGWSGISDGAIRATIGLGLRDALASLFPEARHGDSDRLLACYREHWHGGFRDHPFLFPGVVNVLERLAKEGFLLAVATGKSRRGLEYALEQSSLTGFFHATRTADEAFSKPHPQMLLDLLEELGTRAGDAVMLGDTTYDLDMAHNAGAVPVGVLSGSHSREELVRSRPAAILDSVVELPSWLGLGAPRPRRDDSANAADRHASRPAV